MQSDSLPVRLAMLTKLIDGEAVMEWLGMIAADITPIVQKGLEIIAKLLGFVATGLPAYAVISKYIAKNANSVDFQLWFGSGRKVKGLGSLRFFQKSGALNSRNEISNAVKQQLTREIAKDVVHSYSIERRSHRLSRDTRDFISFMVTMLICAILLIVLVALPKSESVSSAQQPFVSFVAFMLFWSIVIFFGFAVLQCYFVFTRFRDEGSSTTNARNAQLVIVPFDSIRYCVEKESDYIFVDATIRERYQVPFMGKAEGVQMLLDPGAVIEGEVALKKSEARQVKSDDYEEVAGQLVDSFLSKASIRVSEPVCFVFSQAGITAVLVTQLLRRKGLRAFYIGATNGYESEVRETIREIRILRESGLI